ncbi:MAG: hypothetical protein WDZ77_00300 [Candidatus Pacearchaeota archaeon]
MQIEIDLKKRSVFFLAIFISILGILTVFAATPFSSNIGWHPLQQVTTDETGSASIDANSDGIIDNAAHAITADSATTATTATNSDSADSAQTFQGVNIDQFCRSNGDNCPPKYVWSDPVLDFSGCDIGQYIGNDELSGECSPQGDIHYFEFAGSSCGAESIEVTRYKQTCE